MIGPLDDDPSSGPIQVEILPRDPLPAFPPGQYDRDLWFTPPVGPDRRYCRGNFSGIDVAGAPPVVGGANATRPGRPTDLIFTPHLDRYPVEWQERILTAYASRGYTHIALSLGHMAGPHERAISGLPILSPDEVLDVLDRAKRYVPYVDLFWLGATMGERDEPWRVLQPKIQPYLDAILPSKLTDLGTIGWQWNLWQVPGKHSLEIIFGLGHLLAEQDIDPYIHWANDAVAWFDGTVEGCRDRFEWYDRTRAVLAGNHLQGDVDSDIPYYQSRICDVLNHMHLYTSGVTGQPLALVDFENSAQKRFDRYGARPGEPEWPAFTEADQDLRGRLIAATKAPTPLAGYMNGARREPGTRL